MYKYQQSCVQERSVDDIAGIDKLLLKLEYNAVTDKGRLASDYGVPNKILEYYENEENRKLIQQFDSFEKEKFKQIETILNKKNFI